MVDASTLGMICVKGLGEEVAFLMLVVRVGNFLQLWDGMALNVSSPCVSGIMLVFGHVNMCSPFSE